MTATIKQDWLGGANQKPAQNLVRILLCDDDEVFLQGLKHRVERFLEAHGVPAMIHALQGWQNLADKMLSSCDIALLDIDFDASTYTGMDIAKKLRAVREDAVIIFVTNFIEYAPAGFEVQAFRYLLKCEIDQKFDLYLKQALTKLHSTRKTIKIKSYGEIIDLAVENIRYIESCQHTVSIRLKDGVAHICYAALSTLEEVLVPLGFLRVHRSILVNMAYIQKFQRKELLLTDGTVLKVSEKNYGELKKQYLLWKGRPEWSIG